MLDGWMVNLFCTALLVNYGISEDIAIFDGIANGRDAYGGHKDVKDWAELKLDPNSEPLSTTFTICSSLSTTALSSTFYFWSLLSSDNEGGVYFGLYQSDELQRTHELQFGVNGLINTISEEWVEKVPMQIFWYHACSSIDLDSGHTISVVNGIEVMNEEVPALREFAATRPTNLTNRLVMSKAFTGFWITSRQRTTNLNVYSRLLSKAEMQAKTTEGCGVSDGDYLKWTDMEWNMYGDVKMTSVTKEALCRNYLDIVFFHPTIHQPTCMNICKNLQGTGAPVAKEADYNDLLNLQKKVLSLVSPKVLSNWMSVTDEAEEGVWMDRSGEILEHSPWSDGYPNGGTSRNCAVMFTAGGVWDWFCQISKKEKVACACKFVNKPYVTLRGLCEDSNLERVYLPANNHLNGELTYYGLLRAKIEHEGVIWRLKHAGNTTAESEAEKRTFVLGKKLWTVENDSYKCNKGEPYQARLKLTGCQTGEFTCDDGQCVKMEQRCNQLPECADESDEIDCQLMVLKKEYNQNVPPITAVSTTNFTVVPVPVQISLTLMKIVSIQEVDHMITLQFEIVLEWAEVRVIYHNLKRESSLNALNNDDTGKLWLPYAIFDNTDDKEAVKLEEDVKTTLVISRKGEFVRSGMEFVDETEIFEGKENPITLRQTHSKEFQCKYRLHNYPFDKQVCSIKIVTQSLDRKMVSFLAKEVVMEEELELTMYFIQKWLLINSENGSVKFIIVLERRFMSELLSTYLPSVLLLGISFATVFFKAEYFEAALTVNLTNMLVLTTIFISVMQTLPQTAYIKHIDIWLIFCQLIPFLEVLLITAAEAMRKPDASGEMTYNHHGHVRNIQVEDKF